MDNKNDPKDDTGWTTEESERAAAGGSMSDTLKKLFTAGVSAAFMTEESIRSFVSEMKLPKETLNILLQGAAKSKEELMNRVTREVIGIISKIDFVKEASRFAEEHKFRVTAEIEVIRKEPKDTSKDTQVQQASEHAPSESSVEIRFENPKPSKS